jgi:DNA-binding XRE family transcriptional regulator
MPRKNTQSTDYPQAVIRQIDLLAQNIVVARKRRKETQAQWAKRLGVSQPTMARIEKGDPSVAMASYVMCMWLIQPDCSLADLIAPQHDTIALEREIAKVQPRRAPGGSNSLADAAKNLGYNSAAELARGMNGHSNQAAVGLAALIAKAQGRSQ